MISVTKKKGFTLIELLIILAVLGLLGVAALTSYFNSTKTFGFIGDYKAVVSTFRTAKNFAVTNKAVKESAEDYFPDRFGIYLEENKVTFFADVGDRPYKFDPASDIILKDKTFDYSEGEVEFMVFRSDKSKFIPAAMFYDKTTGEFNSFEIHSGTETYTEVSKIDSPYLAVFMRDAGKNLERWMIIYQVSGIPEEFKNWSF